MSSDLDLVLQDLEKQVNDFSIGIVDSNTNNGPFIATAGEESLQQTHTTLNHPSSKERASPKAIGLARTVSAAGTRKFPKKLLPDEPIPCLPPQSSISLTTLETSLISSPTSNCVTNASINTNTESLEQNTPLNRTDLKKEPSSAGYTMIDPSNHHETKRGMTRQHNDSTKQHYRHHHHQGTTTAAPETTIMAPTKTVATRIFIEDGKAHKMVQLTNVLTTAMVIQYLRRKELLDNSVEWTLFEIANSHGVERPLRLWEIVMDITSCWEQNANNALLVKKYSFHDSLSINGIRDRPSPIHGWLNIEIKKGKWQKRYCFIKDNAIHHAKDSKCANSALFCPLAGFDVYTLLQPCTTSPTPFVFALRAQNRAAIFEKEYDYIRLLTAESQERLETWVLGIRQAKSITHYQEHPERVQNPSAPLTTTTSPTGGDSNLRRHKSTKREDVNINDDRIKGMSRSKSTSRRITDESIKRNASTRGLSRSVTTRNREHHPSTPSHDIKDANENTVTYMPIDDGSNTLIHIEDKVKFSKGSLLAKSSPTSTITATVPPTAAIPNPTPHHSKSMMSRSKSTREHQRPRTEEGTLSHHTSIRRKDRNQHRLQHDVPLPNAHAIMTSSSGNPLSNNPSAYNPTLLQLNNTPERFHTQTLLNRQMKPLLNFDQDQRRQ